ncbi:DUF2076 domain-containing protein [Labrys monachus]|uniref:DUF2076 domain-containing protein n=1 Tax=Labrys monachus TaxID=217067 RepID=A0ABU0FMJ9_9HYPH|nr:DUF2076 domain-containing protein [Labrys monachus]MDQ0395827.1 hypothetical protein [Labrys monachus]
MTPDEKSLIEDLFNRLRSATPGGRDAEAERAIEAEMARSPGAAYALVQTVLVQDHALREAHDKLRAAEAAAQQAAEQRQQQPAPSFLERAGSALSGFGQRRDAPPPPPQGQPYQPGAYQPGPYQAPEPPAASAPQGGGFMRGALQTAAGVAGGALLFEGVRSMFGGGGGLLGGGANASGLLGGGGGLEGPWGRQAPETVNETIINEAPRDDRNDDRDNRADSRDDNVRDAAYDSPDDDYGDDTDYDNDDGGSNDDDWV